jgi:hypothetical protein
MKNIYFSENTSFLLNNMKINTISKKKHTQKRKTKLKTSNKVQMCF